MADKFCECGSQMAFKSGVNKEGKAWQGWFCSQPKEVCGRVEWTKAQNK